MVTGYDNHKSCERKSSSIDPEAARWGGDPLPDNLTESDSFMDIVNSILHSPRVEMDPFQLSLPPLAMPTSFKAIANALTSRPPSRTVMGIPTTMPNVQSARSAMIEDAKSNRTSGSGIILISPRMMDGCMGFDITRMPSLTVSERMMFL